LNVSVAGYQAATTATSSLHCAAKPSAIPPPCEKPTTPILPGSALGRGRALAIASFTAALTAAALRDGIRVLESNSATS
jgi:hypothetical protein